MRTLHCRRTEFVAKFSSCGIFWKIVTFSLDWNNVSWAMKNIWMPRHSFPTKLLYSKTTLRFMVSYLVIVQNMTQFYSYAFYPNVVQNILRSFVQSQQFFFAYKLPSVRSNVYTLVSHSQIMLPNNSVVCFWSHSSPLKVTPLFQMTPNTCFRLCWIHTSALLKSGQCKF